MHRQDISGFIYFSDIDIIPSSSRIMGKFRSENISFGIFKKYRLGRGFTNYLLDDNGVIIAKNISAAELSAYLN